MKLFRLPKQFTAIALALLLLLSPGYPVVAQVDRPGPLEYLQSRQKEAAQRFLQSNYTDFGAWAESEYYRMLIEHQEREKQEAELKARLAAFSQAVQERLEVYKGGGGKRSVVFQVGLNEYYVDNQLPGVKMDVAPFVENGRTFVPVRYLSNALGVKNENIAWDGATGKVTLAEPGYPVVELSVGRAEVLSDGRPVPGVDVAPLLRSARTFLPARFVAQALGYEVKWDPELSLVVCWPKGQPEPDVSAVARELMNWTWTETGYRVPKPEGELVRVWDAEGNCNTKAGLRINLCRDGLYGLELRLAIQPPDYNGSWEAYDQAEAVLASKFGPEFAKQVMDYVRQKKSRKDKLPDKEFLAPTGNRVVVTAQEGAVIRIFKS